MELRHVRYFLAVAETLSFTKGAARLRIAQPSLTRQIKDLEGELGVQLFDRSNKRVKLTREGELFLAGAKRLLGFSAEMIQSVQGLKERPSAAINIGYVPNPFHRALPMTLASFEKEFPHVSINLFGMSSIDQLRSLHDGKIDIGFIGLVKSADGDSLQFRVVARHRAVLARPVNHRLGRKKTVQLRDLESALFITLSEAFYPGYTAWLNETCGAAGFRPRVSQVAESEFAVIAAIQAEAGIAVMPDAIRPLSEKDMVISEIEPPVHLPSWIAWRKENQSAALQGYLDLLARADRRLA